MSRNLAQRRDSIHVYRTLNARSHPDIRRPFEPIRERQRVLRTLGQDLKLMPRRGFHDSKYPLDKIERNVLMKEIGHRIHEDAPRLPPPQRNLQRIRLKRQFEGVSVLMNAHGLQPVGHPLGIAMFAARTDLRATRYRIPSSVRPFDRRTLCHGAPKIYLTKSQLSRKTRLIIDIDAKTRCICSQSA